jgi:hypothetical protein
VNWAHYSALSPAEQALARFWFYVGLLQGQAEAIWWQIILAGCGYEWDSESGRFVARTR